MYFLWLITTSDSKYMKWYHREIKYATDIKITKKIILLQEIRLII